MTSFLNLNLNLFQIIIQNTLLVTRTQTHIASDENLQKIYKCTNQNLYPDQNTQYIMTYLSDLFLHYSSLWISRSDGVIKAGLRVE